VWDISPEFRAGIPEWFFQLAEVGGGARLNESSGVLEPIPNRSAVLLSLRQEAVEESGDGFVVSIWRMVLLRPFGAKYFSVRSFFR
jgi:hypothetical protein